MKSFTLLIFIILSSVIVKAQEEIIPDSIADKIIDHTEISFPKFYQTFQFIKTNDALIKRFIFIDVKGIGPAFASPNGTIKINLDYLKNKKPNFDQDRLIVVLYHEIGHLHYYSTTDRNQWNPENSEKAAFEYSLLKTKEMAEKGDCLPLKAGVKFMKVRSLSSDLKDAHVRALKRMVNESLYADYIRYINLHCKE
ncbi:M48 family metalloprotease [Pedobacter paludis]|uniref:IrrE N-terminal-like domain-containing protein n=1 Tax=Pedobacter paludis TaxID=2203212 RepID=A0A317F8E3_9SPHI|nr:hypothetical protein [Pedobacter paludis]PWS33828.1 hypothetical protein DF947_04260 [Pedobacter paludis]